MYPHWALVVCVLGSALFAPLPACAAAWVPPTCEFSLMGDPPLFTTGQKGDTSLRIMISSLTGDEFVKPQLKYTVSSLDGKAVAAKSLALSGSLVAGSALAVIAPPVDKPGWYKVALEFSDKAGSYTLRNRALPGPKAAYATYAVVAPPAKGPQPESFFGVCEHELTPELTAAMTMAGVRWMRTDAAWGNVQPDPDTWDWDRFDSLVDSCESAGIQVLPIVDYGNAWSNGLDDGERKLPSEADWVRFVTQLVDRYKSRMKYWEIWNEPNIPQFWLGTNAEYATLLRWSYAAVKAADPKAIVVMGGTSGTDIGWIRQLYAAGATASVDETAVHPYMQPSAPERGLARSLESERAMEAQYTSPKPLWVTEMGYQTSGGGAVDELTQSRFLPRAMIMASAAGVKHFMWYELSNPGSNPEDSESNFGIVYPDAEPKPSFVAYAALERLMGAGGSATKVLYPDRRVAAYSLTRGLGAKATNSALAVWCLQGTSELQVRSAKVEVMDYAGSRQVLTAKDGVVSVPLSESPAYLLGVSDSQVIKPAVPEGAAGPTGQNLAVNGDFETHASPKATVPTGWLWGLAGTPKATIRFIHGDAAASGDSNGAYVSLAYGSARECNVFGHLYRDIRVKPFTSYRLSARVRTTSCAMAWVGGGPGWGVRLPFPTDTAGQWVTVSTTFDTWEETSWPLMVLVEEYATSCDVDDVQVVEVP